MAPILHIMRHGQGYHSEAVTKNGHLLRDPHLTEKGKEQCRERCAAFPRHENIELLLASPLRRALQTCAISFAPCVERGLVIHAIPHAEEVSDAPADTGSPVHTLKDEFGALVDFSLIASPETWFKHEGEFAIDAAAVNARAARLRRWIRARPEREVALVSHGFFNHFTTGEVDDKGNQTTPWWGEAELRTYVFEQPDAGDKEDEVAMIRETEKSRVGRGLSPEEVPDAGKVVKNEPALRGKGAKEGSDE